MSRYALVTLDSEPSAVLFQTTGAEPQWVGENHLDAARIRLVRAGTGKTLLADHWVCEQDITSLQNAILDARARYALMDGCRRTGCENRTDRPDLLCTVHAEVAEDVSARIRSES